MLRRQKIRVWYAFDTTPYTHTPHRTLPQSLVPDIPLGGFHGWSHLHAARHAQRKGWKEYLTVHTGSGNSITAWKGTRTVWTSMSITPLDGVIGSTRSGSIDPGLVLWLVKRLGRTRVERILWHESGWNALTGEKDFRRIFAKRKEAGYTRAFEAYTISLAEQVNRALAHLTTPNGIIFTGPISSNRIIRRRIMRRTHLTLESVWIETDEEREIWIAWEKGLCWHAQRDKTPRIF